MLPFKAGAFTGNLTSYLQKTVENLAGMGNEASALPSDSSITPMSEASYPPIGGPPPSSISLDGGARSRSMSRRSSASSSTQHSPVGHPDVDLSHLNEEERAQIAAVIARAKEVQEQEAQMVRDLEEEFSTYTATVDTRRKASLAGSEHSFLSSLTSRDLCSVCSQTELTEDNHEACADCGEYVCSQCGQYETAPSSQVHEWLCMVCLKRRKLMTTTGMWYYGRHTGQDFPNIDVPERDKAQPASTKHSEHSPHEGRSPVRSDINIPPNDQQRSEMKQQQQRHQQHHQQQQLQGAVAAAPHEPQTSKTQQAPREVHSTPRAKPVPPKPIAQEAPAPPTQRDKPTAPKVQQDRSLRGQLSSDHSSGPKRATPSRMRSQHSHGEGSGFVVDVDALVAKAMEISTPERSAHPEETGNIQVDDTESRQTKVPSQVRKKQGRFDVNESTNDSRQQIEPRGRGAPSDPEAQEQKPPGAGQSDLTLLQPQKQQSFGEKLPMQQEQELQKLHHQQQLLEQQRQLLLQQPPLSSPSMQEMQRQEEQRIRHQQQLLEQQRQMMQQSQKKHQSQNEKDTNRQDLAENVSHPPLEDDQIRRVKQRKRHETNDQMIQSPREQQVSDATTSEKQQQKQPLTATTKHERQQTRQHPPGLAGSKHDRHQQRQQQTSSVETQAERQQIRQQQASALETKPERQQQRQPQPGYANQTDKQQKKQPPSGAVETKAGRQHSWQQQDDIDDDKMEKQQRSQRPSAVDDSRQERQHERAHQESPELKYDRPKTDHHQPQQDIEHHRPIKKERQKPESVDSRQDPVQQRLHPSVLPESRQNKLQQRPQQAPVLHSTQDKPQGQQPPSSEQFKQGSQMKHPDSETRRSDRQQQGDVDRREQAQQQKEQDVVERSRPERQQPRYKQSDVDNARDVKLQRHQLPNEKQQYIEPKTQQTAANVLHQRQQPPPRQQNDQPSQSTQPHSYPQASAAQTEQKRQAHPPGDQESSVLQTSGKFDDHTKQAAAMGDVTRDKTTSKTINKAPTDVTQFYQRGPHRVIYADNGSTRSTPTQSRTRVVGESSGSDMDSDREWREMGQYAQNQQQMPRQTEGDHPPSGNDLDSDENGALLDDDFSRRKSPRPQHLVLSRQHSSTSNSSDDESITGPIRSKKPIPPQKPKRPLLEKNGKSHDAVMPDHHDKFTTDIHRVPQQQIDVTRALPQSEDSRRGLQQHDQFQGGSHSSARTDAKSLPRTGGEGAEVPVKKKPYPLDRKTSAEHRESDRTVSPGGRSSKSPKSPPRSPNWMRYRDSPPRSPPIRSISPNKSPTERFPSNYVDISPTGMAREGTYGEEFECGQSGNVFSFDHGGAVASTTVDAQCSHDRAPPKPARTNNHHAGDGNHPLSATHVLDLASYAATVANDTDHLTSMSVSPTNLQVPDHGDSGDYNDRSPDQDSSSPLSPNYYEEVDEVNVCDPTPKSIDYQGSKRQKVKPPSTDWSPVTDLSPIIDVSPSVERLEQEKMIAEQQKLMGTSDLGQPGTMSSTVDRTQQALLPKAKPTPLVQQLKEDEEEHTLRRFKVVEDVSSLSEPVEEMPRRELQRSERMENIQEMIHSSQRGNEACLALQNKAQLESADSKESLDSEIHLSDTELKRTYHRVEKEEHILSDDEQEIDLDADIPPKPWEQNDGATSTIKRAPHVRSLSESESLARDRNEFMSVQERKRQFEKQIAQHNDTSSTKQTDRSATSSPDSVSSSQSRASSREGRSGSPKSRDNSKGSSSPGSPGESSRRVRRRLPPVPKGTEAVKPVRRPRSHSADSRLNSDKDFLRKRLMEKEVEIRRGSAPLSDKNSKPVTRGRQPAVTKRKTLPATTVASVSFQPALQAVVSKPKTTTGVVSTSTATSATRNAVTNTDNAETKKEQTEKKAPVVPPKPTKPKLTKPKESQPVEMVSIHGLKVPVDVKSLKQRIKEEMQIVTATRRLKLDEMEEIRRMEAQLAERDKERKSKIAEENAKRKKEAEQKKKEKDEKEKEKERERIEREQRLLADKFAPPVQDSSRFETRKKLAPQQLSTRASPQPSPRRGRHRRQNSDPMIAKFSPIEEARDIEGDLQYSIEREARRLATDLSKFSPQLGRHVRRLGSKTPPASSDYMFAGGMPLIHSALSRSSELLDKYSQMEQTAARLCNSRSESNLPMTMSRTLGYYSDEEDQLTKEAKKYHLQAEIEKRKRQIEETARLRYEIQRLADNANVSPYEVTYAYPSYQPQVVDTQHPAGIIKPLDYQIAFLEPDDYSQREYAAYRDIMELSTGQPYVGTQYTDPTYSSGDYLAHRGHQRRMQMPSSHVDAIDLAVHSGQYGFQDPYQLAQVGYMSHPYASSMDALQIYPSEGPLPPSGYHVASAGAGGNASLSPSLSMPLSNQNANYRYEQVQSQMAPKITYVHSVPSMAVGGATAGTLTGPSSAHTDTDGTSCTPGSDHTPAMPILGDVTMRSRSLLRDIGSRPLSDDMEKYLQVQDPMAVMLRAGSDRSIAESVDEHAMEGGVTIRRQTDRKKEGPGTCAAAMAVRKYEFATKRILVTRDPKDRTVKAGNGLGLKIVGGKMASDGEGDSMAYVAAIYPGGVADQLHGELQEGDQVLEWNGTGLTGKSYEEVQQIISAPLGEIEIVIRPGANLSTKHSHTMSTLESGSCHSSYDNLECYTSDYDEFDRYVEASESGIDPNALAAQLEGIPIEPPGETPGTSPSSSQQDMFLTPSMSTPASSEPTDPPSPSVELLPSNASDEKPPPYVDTGEYGEVQLQLSYDDFDGTLNIHVIQARGLRVKDTNGFSDPFCKVCLLPGRTADNKRRTKYIPRTLNPEWHQTLVFMKISREELHSKTMEVAVWDYDRFKTNDFLGEVLLDLSDNTFLDNKPHWYRLHEHVAGNVQRVSKPRPLSPQTSSSSSTSQRSRVKHSSRERPKDQRSSRPETTAQAGNIALTKTKHTAQIEKATTIPRPRDKRLPDKRSRDQTKPSHRSRDSRSTAQRPYDDRPTHARSRETSATRSNTRERTQKSHDQGYNTLPVKSNVAEPRPSGASKSRSRSRDISPAGPRASSQPGTLQSQMDPKHSRYSPGLGRRNTPSSSHDSTFKA